jgi:HEAT repeat protein
MGLVKGKTAEPGANASAKAEPNCEELRTALENADAGIRRHAARAIAGCLDSSHALVNRLQREEDSAVREVILNSLARLNDVVAVEGLVRCLRSEDAALRNEVIETIRQMGSEVAPVLESLLADPDPDVRIFVVNILDSERHPEIENWLIRVIDQDAHVNVCATAVDQLCEVGSEAAVEPLLRLKVRFASEAYIQFAVDLALKRIRGI